jgi:hypothetical protein
LNATVEYLGPDIATVIEMTGQQDTGYSNLDAIQLIVCRMNAFYVSRIETMRFGRGGTVVNDRWGLIDFHEPAMKDNSIEIAFLQLTTV